MLQEFSKWQLIETYRIINTVLVSCAESINPIRSSLALLKTKLEAEPYLKELLTQIDNGQLQTDLVCSGHGVWYQKDGEIDLSHFPPTTTVYLYSGLGASLSDEVGTKIENAALEPNELVLQKKSTREIVAPSAPTLFSSSSQHSKIPNFCLINDKENLPLARVIEPLTGRTVYSVEDAPKKRNYFSLGNVLEKHQGSEVV